MLIWQGSPSRDTVLHIMSVFASLAQFLTPLAIKDLLHAGNDVTSANATACGLVNHTAESVVFSPDVLLNNRTVNSMHAVETGQFSYNFTINNSNLSNNSITNETPDVGLSRYAFVMVGCFPIIGAVVSTFNYFAFAGYKKLCIDQNHKSQEVKDTRMTESMSNLKITPSRIVVLALLCPYMFTCNWMESNPGAYLSSFVVKGLCMDIQTGSEITSLYWGCHGIGRFLTIFVSKWVKPKFILYSLFTSYSTAVTVGLFIPMLPQLVWVTAVLGGLGASSMYFATLLWVSDYVAITGRVSAMCITFIYFGGIAGPLFMGNMFQAYGFMWVIYIQIGTISMQVMLFLSIEIFAKIKGLGAHGTNIKAEMANTQDELKDLNSGVS